jgi:uncharacterized protein (TIGR03435 family)
MKRLLMYSLFLLFFGVTCCAQSAGKLSFEVASIKPSEPQPMNQTRIGMNTDAGMLRYTNVSLKDVVRVAYRVKDFQVEGPDWMGSARFDIVAKFPAGATQDNVPEMLQDLLTERFKLALHRDSKEHAIYALVPGKDGPKLKPAEVQTRQEAPPAGAAPRPGGGPPRGALMLMMDSSGMHLKAPAVTLTNLCDAISRFTERPVLDMTNIQGQYDFDLVFMPETTHGMTRMGPPPAAAGVDHSPDGSAPSEPGASVYEAVQRYGLKLEPRKAPMDILVIDHIEKTPTEN